MVHLQCIGCGRTYPPDKVIYLCQSCGDLLDVSYDYSEVSELLEESTWGTRPLGVWRYRELLPVAYSPRTVTLNEGGTGLYHTSRLGPEIGLSRLYVKCEGENPTGSFKDRGMTVGVTKALDLGARTVACASTGNTSSSLAAYAAKAGLKCIVLVPSGRIALGKLAQAMIHGAIVVAVHGSFDDALSLVRLIAEEAGLYLLNSINPFRLEGQKTAAYEVCDQLAWKAPDALVLPVGNAGNISAYWKGFKELKALGIINSVPRMIGVQAEGASPIAKAVRDRRETIEPLKEAETVASAIRIGSPVNWKKALKAIQESKGLAVTVSEDEILEAQRLLARNEGLFTEPAGACPIAALGRLKEEGEVDSNDTVVCIATGHGLKDPDIVLKTSGEPIEVEASVESLRRVLGV